MKEAIVSLEKLSPTSDDIVVVRVRKGISRQSYDQLSRGFERWKQSTGNDPFIVLVEESVNFETMPLEHLQAILRRREAEAVPVIPGSG
jgi:hypothetical protein